MPKKPIFFAEKDTLGTLGDATDRTVALFVYKKMKM
jgi:hypothetical protein